MSRESKRAASRQGVKNLRRVQRRRKAGRRIPKWLSNQPIHKIGSGGTDKSGTVKPSPTYYSDANAERLRGHPSEWPGIPFRGK